jgi:predicted NBD/HSP70 family sugar kinase
MSTFVAVDIGGTHIRAAAYESDNITPLTHKRTRSHAKEPGTFDRLVKAIESAWPKDRSVEAIGMASPGPLDPKQGSCWRLPTSRNGSISR